ncbi:DUF4191 domain-containing protein [Nocardiopsis changdeensis]|uniref:DUF4191 domain-containing protein n=1 Tax=Nocardiopsis changdeensis TaxID=2831969 RepID=A0ABX8BQY5_9ACTN|nr:MULTISPECIES: DUF4191 domain-containing protein [Nocardiopsis]QUX24447.1 DUF4191 domain-containing protein [Nocardiopsis changdeensis]QYX34838.1 DUF4191 domain-containing protein [Nocardiopsis sp. MT53]
MAKKGSESTAPAQGKDKKEPGRLKQIGMVAKVVHRQSPRSIPLAAGVAVLILAVFVAIGIWTGSWILWPLTGLPIALLTGFIIFTRSAQRVQYQILDGQIGAGAAILDNMRGNWTTEFAVNANRQQDVVHRVVGRPGVILVGEGDPHRLKSLIASEKKRVSRVALDTPIYDYKVGNGEDQVPLAKLQRTLVRLPRTLDKKDVTQLNYRLRALPAKMQMPKGPMPKNAKMPRGLRGQSGG